MALRLSLSAFGVPPDRFRGPRRTLAALLAPAALLLTAGAGGPASHPVSGVAAVDAAGAPLPLVAERRYRVVGRIRLLLFWISSDNVGSARMTWRGSGRARSIALLIGSDPARAPRGLNEWSYHREEIHPGFAEDLDVRRATDVESISRDSAPGGDPPYGVACSIVDAAGAHSELAVVDIGPDVTYRTFDRYLDLVEAAPADAWHERRAPRPPDAHSGFLVALDRLMREVVAPSRHGSPPPVAYFYRGGLYDLILRKVEAVKDAGAAAADHLVRGDFTIRNRTTHTESKFAVTYPRAGTDAFRPVRITFQPNWWLAVELRLDEQVDAPPDPAADPATLARIRALCPAER